MTIWKFVINKEKQDILIPKDARILCVASQYDNVCLWVQCDPSNQGVLRSFEVFGTGVHFELTTAHAYIGTAILHHGALVLHVYEKGTST